MKVIVTALRRVVTSAVLGTALLLAPTMAPGARADEHDTYEAEEIFDKATGFFGDVSEGLAKAIEKAFADEGLPNAYIEGEEASGAIGIGLRYGKGRLHRKMAESREIFWQGPSIGFDFGGDASKVFVLIYKLKDTDDLFQRYPGVDGSVFLLAGFGLHYERSGDITLAPIRSGVGLRAGANVGYTKYTRKRSWLPF